MASVRHSAASEHRRLMRSILVLFGIVGLAVTLIPKSILSGPRPAADGERMSKVRELALPTTEISGFALGPVQADGREELFVVGDTMAEIVRVGIAREGLGRIDGEVIRDSFASALTQRFSMCSRGGNPVCDRMIADITSQWEAIAVDGLGTRWVLQETSGAVVAVGGSGDASRVMGVVDLDFSVFDRYLKLQSQPQLTSAPLGEGMVLLRNGHILVAKERRPAAFVEFGPFGAVPLGLSGGTVLPRGAEFVPAGGFVDGRAAYVPLAMWKRGDDRSQCDLSELTVDRETGRIFALSQNCRQLIELPPLVVGEPNVVPVGAWTLDSGIENAEALIVHRGEVWIGSDLRTERVNVHVYSVPQ